MVSKFWRTLGCKTHLLHSSLVPVPQHARADLWRSCFPEAPAFTGHKIGSASLQETFEFTGRGRQLARGQSEEEVCLLRRRPSALHNARDHDGQVTLRMLFRVSCTTLNNTAFVREIDVAESAWTIETEVLEVQSCVSARGLSVLSIVGTTSCMEWCVEQMRVCEWFTLMTKIMSGLA